VLGYITVLLHGPVNALTFIRRLLRGGDDVGGAAAACHKVDKCPGYAALRLVRDAYVRAAVASALTYG
jgi:hypothetical protein